MNYRLFKIDRGHYKPLTNKRGLKPAAVPCVKPGCEHPAFRYRVNHIEVSMCRCHAYRIAKRKGVRVIAI